jgi:NAD(P)-dependent dehydrogenase (short-subunit alcohol dehydrogenase family)
MIALVTGGNRGLGREVCRQLAGLGFTVLLTARSEDAAAAAAGRLGGKVLARQLDVTRPEHIDRLESEITDRFGHLDVLVNNAAITYDTWQRAVTADLDVVREAMETNFYGPWRLTQALAPALRSGTHPRVVNVSSGAASLTEMGGGTPAYTTSKVALNALTRMVAAELRPHGVLVNAVCPGWVATDMGGAGGRPVADGAAGIVWAATLPDDGPTGGFFRDAEPVPW